MAGKSTKGLFNHFALTKKGKSSGAGGKSSDYLPFDTFVTPKLPDIKRSLRPEEGELRSQSVDCRVCMQCFLRYFSCYFFRK